MQFIKYNYERTHLSREPWLLPMDNCLDPIISPPESNNIVWQFLKMDSLELVNELVENPYTWKKGFVLHWPRDFQKYWLSPCYTISRKNKRFKLLSFDECIVLFLTVLYIFSWETYGVSFMKKSLSLPKNIFSYWNKQYLEKSRKLTHVSAIIILSMSKETKELIKTSSCGKIVFMAKT